MTPENAKLLAWYDARKRDLPWRQARIEERGGAERRGGSPPGGRRADQGRIDPFRVWVSEIMLQQTRVETVIGYYERFLARFPTATALADAALDDVLALWSGLGYYARARNLHRAAKRICDEHGGVFPRDAEAVRGLPGIGAYTAGAILSIAFGQREPLVDGNVIRVLSRLRSLPGHAKEGRLKSACWEIARALVPAERPGDFNQALMELGATVCTPRSPRCGECPLRGSCAARESGRAEEIPAPAPKRTRPHRKVDCALIARGERVLLVRRPDEGLLGGLWELPSAPRRGRSGAALPVAILDALGLSVSVGARVARVEHAFTHFDLTLDAFACESTGEPDAPARWVAREELASYGMGAAMRRILEADPSRARVQPRRPRAARESEPRRRRRSASGRPRRPARAPRRPVPRSIR